MGTHRRYCPTCGHGWTGKDSKGKPLLLAGLVLAVVAVSIVLGWALGVSMLTDGPGAPAGTRMPSPQEAGAAWTPVQDGEADSTPELAAEEAGEPGVAGEPKEPAGQPDVIEGEPKARGRAAPIRLDPPVPPSVLGRMNAMFGDVSKMMKLLNSSQQAEVTADIDRLSKKELWDKYGHYFGSKEQAKQAYEQHKGRPRPAPAAPTGRP
ncbi:MAG: hypothetical protein HY927_08360 [Elusimicrobia bacterium]|nr:hypothetical protein [Elusimicrobiota bacterium]